MFGISRCESGSNSSHSQTLADRFRIIPSVAQHAIWTVAGTPLFSLQRYCINKCQRFLRVITVSAGQVDRKRDSVGITNQMTLAPQLGTVGRIRSGLWPPKTARIEQLSTITLDQSIREYRASQSRSAK
jgi:hypothetical protein